MLTMRKKTIRSYSDVRHGSFPCFGVNPSKNDVVYAMSCVCISSALIAAPERTHITPKEKDELYSKHVPTLTRY